MARWIMLLFCTPALWSTWAAGVEPPPVQSADDAAIRALPSVQKAAELLRADKAHKTADASAYIN